LSTASDEKVCPRCAETVKSAAQVCRFCGYSFAGAARQQPGDRPAQQGISKGKAAIALGALLGVAWCAAEPDSPSTADTSTGAAESTSAQTLSADVVAKCRDLLALSEGSGVIRARPAPNRINVEDSTWAALDAETKDRMMQAVACDLWQTSMPPEAEHVVAYGHRSGERLQMLTSVGMARE
jgi:Uncharacterised protein family UPF0547